MDFLWDTNILLHQIRQSSFFEEWDKSHQLFYPSNRNFISIVTVGEIHSLARQLNWQEKKLERLTTYLAALSPLTIAKESAINAYAEIDVFSQGKLSRKPLPKGLTA